MQAMLHNTIHSASNFVLLILLEHDELTAVVAAGVVSCSDCLEYFAEVCSHPRQLVQ